MILSENDVYLLYQQGKNWYCEIDNIRLTINCYAKKSAEELLKHAEKVYANYCDAPVKSFIIGHEEILGAEKVSLSELPESAKLNLPLWPIFV